MGLLNKILPELFTDDERDYNWGKIKYIIDYMFDHFNEITFVNPYPKRLKYETRISINNYRYHVEIQYLIGRKDDYSGKKHIDFKCYYGNECILWHTTKPLKFEKNKHTFYLDNETENKLGRIWYYLAYGETMEQTKTEKQSILENIPNKN